MAASVANRSDLILEIAGSTTPAVTLSLLKNKDERVKILDLETHDESSTTKTLYHCNCSHA